MSDDTQASQQEPPPPLPGEDFHPEHYLTKVGGKDYLEVKWRIVWLRTKHPEAEIETEHVRIDDTIALFKATAKIYVPHNGVPIGRRLIGMATGYGSEQPGDFRDYIEKAETKAIGRALAALGFGTQFCADHDFGAKQGRVVDSPIDFNQRRGSINGGQQRGQPDKMATDRQKKFLGELFTQVGGANDVPPIDAMTTKEASHWIEVLQERKNQGPKAPSRR